MMTDSIHCKQCLYSLRSLAEVGRCPECGLAYDVRGDSLDGVIDPDRTEFPAFEAACSAICIGLSLWFLIGLIQLFDLYNLLVIVALVWPTVVFTRKTWQGCMSFVKAMRLTK